MLEVEQCSCSHQRWQEVFYDSLDLLISNVNFNIYVESGDHEACLVTCNALSDCGSFWVNWGRCHMVNTTFCPDAGLSLMKPAATEVVYYVKI